MQDNATSAWNGLLKNSLNFMFFIQFLPLRLCFSGKRIVFNQRFQSSFRASSHWVLLLSLS